MSEDEVRQGKQPERRRCPLRQDEERSRYLVPLRAVDLLHPRLAGKHRRPRQFHPTSVMVSGFDIIFFWIARMIAMTMHFIKDENGKTAGSV